MTRIRLGSRGSAMAPGDAALVAVAVAASTALGIALAVVPEAGFPPFVVVVASLPVLAFGAWWAFGLPRAEERSALRYMATAAVAVAVLFVTFNGLRPASGASVADLFFVAGAGFLILNALLVSSRPPPVPSWLTGAAFAVLAIGLLAALLAPPVVNRFVQTTYGDLLPLPVESDFTENVLSALRFSLTMLFIPLIIASVADTRGRLELLVGLWITSAVINSLVALSDSLRLTTVSFQVTGLPFSQLGRESGLTLHPNHLSAVAAMAMPVAFSRATSARTLPERCMYWGALAVVAAGVGLSGSRMGLVAGALGIVLVLALQRHQRRKMVVGLALAATAGVILASAVGASSLDRLSVGLDRLTGKADVKLVQGSDNARRLALDSALSDIADHPIIGTGYTGLRDAHNLYLQLAAAGGLLLVAAFFVFAGGLLRTGVRLSKDGRLPADVQSLAAALTVSIAVWLLAGVAQTPVYDRYLYVPIGLLLGAYFVAVRSAAGSPERPHAADR